jgi:phage shock protein E|tara:strand:+ start:681 stop:1028 length:348 start_codon:yes stop_codon:yes gene_type:complete
MFPVIVLGALTIAAVYAYFGDNYVSSGEAKRLIKEGRITRVVDVRTAAEYRMGHYPNALHIPVDKINEKTTTELPKWGILVYCNTGQRARFAAEKLEKLGFVEVYYIAGLYTSLL